MSSCNLTVTLCKRAGETLARTIDLRDELGRPWRRNVEYSAGQFIRPSKGTGFDYECTTPGRTAEHEPAWPRVVGATVPDGSVTWTCRAPNAASQDQLVSPASFGASDPTGIAAAHVSTEPTGDVLATFSGGTAGVTHSVPMTVATVGGQIIVVNVEIEVGA